MNKTIFSKYFLQRSIFCHRKFCALNNKYYCKKNYNEEFYPIKRFIHFLNLDHGEECKRENALNSQIESKKFRFQNNLQPFTVSQKNFSTSNQLYAYKEGPGNRILYEPSVKGKYKQKPKSNAENFRLGVGELKTEIRKWKDEMKEKLDPDPIFVHAGDTDKVFDFKSEEDLKLWMVSSDQDHNEGFSEGSLTISPTGHGLFSGNIDTRIPKDGMVTAAGYSNMTLIQPRRSFKREISFDWIPYTHLAMRVRGDGRRYLLTLKTSGAFDVSWFDMYIYVLYTRGGPYWQDVKIPFSKFLLNAKGRMQDKQNSIPLSRIKTLGITATGNVNGPFRLELDYIGVHKSPIHKEKFAYEMYRIPAFII